MQRYSSLSHTFYHSVRKKLASKMVKNSLAIIESNTRFRSNADAYHSFKQNSDFYYLTGIREPEVSLLIAKDEMGKVEEFLFIPKISELQKIWEGEVLEIDTARQISDVSNIHFQGDLLKTLKDLIGPATDIYIPKTDLEKWTGLDSERKTIRYIKRHFPKHHTNSLLELIHELRLVKHEEEISAIEMAIKITSEALVKTMNQVRIGKIGFEFELEAELLSSFLKQKSKGFAFEPIIASGINSCTLHYTLNSSRLKSGQVLLMDVGAEYKGYNADITRVFAVGAFAPKAKELFKAVTEVLKDSRKFYKPGSTISEINKNVSVLIERKLLDLDLITTSEIKNQNPKNPAYRKYFMHGAAHFLGLDVHDVGGRDVKLKPGMVLTLEPGIYVPQWETGIRLEDDILITENGSRNLSAEIKIG